MDLGIVAPVHRYLSHLEDGNHGNPGSSAYGVRPIEGGQAWPTWRIAGPDNNNDLLGAMRPDTYHGGLGNVGKRLDRVLDAHRGQRPIGASDDIGHSAFDPQSTAVVEVT